MEFQSRWWHLAAVQIGGAVCLPIFVVGHALAMNYGFLSALAAVGIGNCCLLLLGLAAANYSANKRLTTAESAAETFGSVGKPFFAFILIISMMGWFAVQLDLMGGVAGNLLGIESAKTLNIVLGLMITVVSLRGVKGMELLANICLPLLTLTILYAVFEASKMPLTAPQEDVIVFGGVSLALAAAIGAVIDLPTFFRVAKTQKDALLAAVILFGVALPLIEGVGIYLAVHGSSENLVGSLSEKSTSLLWKGWVALFIIMAGWTTNSTNLYSAVISMKTALSIKKESSCQIILGVFGTCLSLFNVQENLFLFLDSIGILFSSAGGVMVLNQIVSGTNRSFNLAGLFLGLNAGFLNMISGVGIIDAFVVALATALIGSSIIKERNTYEVYRN